MPTRNKPYLVSEVDAMLQILELKGEVKQLMEFLLRRHSVKAIRVAMHRLRIGHSPKAWEAVVKQNKED